MWTRSNSQSTEEKKKFHQVNKQQRWLWNSDPLGEGFMHVQGGNLFFKNTTDPSVIILIMHCLLTFFSLIYVLEASTSKQTRIFKIEVFQESQ